MENYNNDEFDLIVIGGGATGLGIAVEAVSRGYSCLLLEAHDFASGASSKSTKLIHGGIRYLANLDFALVKEGLEEREYFIKNAPHIAKVQPYLIPFYSYGQKIKFTLGVWLYDLIAQKHKLNKSRILNKDEVLTIAPHINPNKLMGGIIYYDGSFDDARMAITLLRTFEALGGTAFNYHQVTKFIKDSEFKILGVKVRDVINSKDIQFMGKHIINATGNLTDQILDLDETGISHKHVSSSQGTHLVFNADVFHSNYATVIPHTIDDRILFILPWHDKIVVGTTDVAVSHPSIEPTPHSEEIDFILETLNQYTLTPITYKSIKSVFAGQRPLVRPPQQSATSKVSRKHEIFTSQSGLVSVCGGKWTIYRKMGQDTIDYLVKRGQLTNSKSISKDLHLFGYCEEDDELYPLNVYGSDKGKIREIQEEICEYGKLHPRLPYYSAEIIYAIRYEMAKTLEDVLARRTRALFLDAKATIEVAPSVAKLMAFEFKRNQSWIDEQVNNFNQFAQKYVVTVE